jgi:hypothetical protein
VATSRTRGLLAYLESRKNLSGSAAGLAGLAGHFAGLTGAYWPVVVAGLYGAGALIAPPERPGAPAFTDPSEQLDELRGDFTTLSAYLVEVDLPPAAAGRLSELNEVLAALLDPGWVAAALARDAEAVHKVSRAVRQDIPESVDAFLRTRWWARLQPGSEPPERHLERQLTLLYDEATALATSLREVEARRQETQTHYLEDRHRAP